MKRILVLFLLVSCIQSAYSQIIRKYSNEFMSIGVDASALAMSGAVTASVADVTAGYWNPAGLVNIENDQIALMHASYFANIAQYDYVGYAKRIDHNSAFAVSGIRFGVDDIMNTTQLIDSEGNIDYSRISMFSAVDYGFSFSYARKLILDGFTYGINAKVIRRIIGDFASSWGVGFDLGVQFQRNSWAYGIMLRDITTTYNVWNINQDRFETISNAVGNQNQEMPETTEITIPKAQIGLSKKMIIRHDYSIQVNMNMNMQFVQTNDLISTKWGSIDPAIGIEAGYIDMVFLRMGVGNFQNVTQIDGVKEVEFQPNIGLGFRYKGVYIDYALTDIGNQSAALYSNIFSVKIDLDLFRR